MSSSISNATQTPTDVVTLKQVRRPTTRKETPSGKEPKSSTASNITLPEDVVTLSSSSRSKAEEASLLAKKKPSLAVTADEKQALLSAGSSKEGFSIHV